MIKGALAAEVDRVQHERAKLVNIRERSGRKRQEAVPEILERVVAHVAHLAGRAPAVLA